ncbi:L-selectin-like, partial [Etheostoma cragini]|uniref:L-selectin-like n=1 Tax=Etheostoma cragini TaxID=417921 RepID=UPI00155F0C9E
MKTWKEAQEYCRTYHTDLATVSNQGDMKRLQQLNQSGAWIGLQRDWHWSQSGVEFRDSNWSSGEPNNQYNKENCVQMYNDGKWNDIHCAYYYKCICYDENKISGNRFHVSDYSMSWREAQNYCRERYTDLISGVQQLEDFKTQFSYYGETFWIGLFRDWSWSDGSRFSFRLWDEHKQDPKKTCGMTTSGGFWSDDCNKTKTFFCYDGESSTRSLTLVFIYICSIYSVKTSSISSVPRTHHHN